MPMDFPPNFNNLYLIFSRKLMVFPPKLKDFFRKLKDPGNPFVGILQKSVKNQAWIKRSFKCFHILHACKKIELRFSTCHLSHQEYIHPDFVDFINMVFVYEIFSEPPYFILLCALPLTTLTCFWHSQSQ